MIAIHELRLQYGPKVLFDGITATVAAHDRVGLVGANGAGKSTLLKVLAGVLDYDGGVLKWVKGATLGYLPQDGVECHGKTLVAEVEGAFDNIHRLRREIDEASARLDHLPHDGDEYRENLDFIADSEAHLADAEPEKMRSRIERVLLGLGFSMADMARDTGEFSGGWQMRIALAKLLLREPSLLLMDEPTNHLDIEAQAWLEAWLSRYRGAVMIVSHDRSFLDSVCNRTFALEGKGKLDAYGGNYSYYKKTAAERRDQLRRAAEIQRREIEEIQDFIDRFRASANKAPQVQSRIKFLDKLERITFEEEDDSQIGFRFPEPPRSGQVVLAFEGMGKRYDDLTVFNKVDFRLERGDRVALVGVNGAGKSTFVKLLAGREPLSSGARIEGPNAAISYFAQHQAAELDPALTVFETVNEVAVGEGTTRLRTLLGAFLFRGEDALKPVGVLSGGERNRLALARMLLRPFNCLILDEPTNHLDMKSKAVLADAVKNFAGTVVIVSHDRDFLDPLITKVVEVRKGGIRTFLGNVSDYLAATADERAAASADARGAPGALAAATGAKSSATGASTSSLQESLDPKERRRRNAERSAKLAPLKKQLVVLEKQIADAEAANAKLETAMTDPAFFSRGPATVADMTGYDAAKKALEAAYETWGTLTDAIADAEAE